MDIRKCYELVIKDQLEKLIVEGCLYLSPDQVNKLSQLLSQNYTFLEELNTFIQDYLEMNEHDGNL